MKNKIKINREYYAGGQLHYQWQQLNGIDHGIQIGYWLNGNQKYQCFQQYGIYHGITQNWHEDSQRKNILTRKSDRIHGTRINFNYAN